MSTRRTVARTALGLVAVMTGLGCCVLVSGLTLGWVDSVARDLIVSLAWVCGLGAVLASVAAVQERTNPDDDPRYLGTIVHGLLNEWRR